jgi:hypothetical protein
MTWGWLYLGPALAVAHHSSMNPDVVAGIARLSREGILSSEQAALFSRVARRELVSVRVEIRALLYLGVLLLTSGVGIFVVEHHADIGRWAIVASIAVASAACLAWVIRSAPPFSWGEVESPSVAFDYVLLLGLLLFASDLAYVEAQFTLLGPRWVHHLLVVASVYVVAAYRWDSRVVLSLGLSTLAAWRGVSVSVMAHSLGAGDAGELRVNAVVLGLLYVIAAVLSVRLDRKAHFEEIFGNAGLLLLFGGLVSGVLLSDLGWGVWLVALLVVAAVVMWISSRVGRPAYFAEAVLAAYVGLVRLLVAPFGDQSTGLPLLLVALLGVGALVLVFAAYKRMPGR